MCIKYAIINQKGGVGKTTTTLNLAYYYSMVMEKRVIAIDLDAQGNLTSWLGVENPRKTVYDFFLGTPVEVIKIQDTLDLVPSNILFAGVEMKIIDKLNREKILERFMAKIIDQYDICLIDCPPALNPITLNALAFADFAIIPLPPSTMALEGINRMMETIIAVRDEVNEKLSIGGIVLTQFNSDRVESKITLERIEQAGYTATLFETKITNTEKFKRAEGERVSIFEYDKNSKAANEYKELAEEIYQRTKNI